MNPEIIYIIGIIFCLPAVYTDYRYKKIYNNHTFPGMILGAFLFYLSGGISGLSSALKGCGAGIALLFIPFALYILSAGDVKLMGTIGAFCGWPRVFDVFMYALIAAGILALIQITVTGRWKKFLSSVVTGTVFFKNLKNTGDDEKFRTGLALAFCSSQIIVYFLNF